MNRFDGKPVYQCMVEGCKNEMDPGSTQSLCRPCYDVITTGNTDRYYADFQGNTWIGQIIRWNHNLRQEVQELEYNQEHAYSFEDGTMSLNDLRNFYVAHKNQALGSTVLDKKLLKNAQDALDKKNMENLSLRDMIRDLEKDHKYKSEIIDNLRKEIDRGNLDHYNNVILKKGHEQKDQHIDSLRKEIEALKKDINYKRENLPLIHENQALKKGHEQKDQYIDSLRKEIEALNYNIDHAHQIDFGKYMSLDDLCIFYQEHNNSPPKDDGKFQAYTNGFWKGFDMGYEKAKEQFDG